MFKTTLKLIFRNWWRNKAFTLISILSLTVGIACTALLISFVSYEYGIEKNNPNRRKLVWVMQDMPSNPGVRVGYMEKGVPEQMKEKYPEVEDFLQLNSFYIRYIEVNNRRFDPIGILNVNSSFPNFLPFDLRYGSWSAFNNPRSIIISERQARKLFGNENAMGKQITVSKSNSEMQKTYTVGAVTKTRFQSAIIFDGLICDPENNWGGPTLLMISPKTDLQQFEEKVQKDEIPTMAGGQYYFSTFDQAISSEYNQQGLGYWHYRKKDLLMVGLASAVLVFIIAIFNYVNLSFSRVLQQVKTLHAQKLMGAKPTDVRLQIFLDTFLTVFISFVLAMLLMHDLLPVFNQVVSVDFSSKYFYDKDFFPLLICLILLLTIIPALVMNRKISRMSISDYQMFFVTRKNRWIGSLVTFQFIIAIALIIATFTANQQVNLVKQNGNRYKNLIELISIDNRQDLRKLKPKITDISGVSDVSLGNSALMDAMVMYGNLRKENGEEFQTLILQLSGDEHLLRVLKLHQLEGEAWETMTENQPNSVLINKSFADKLNKSGTELIGEPLQKYLISDDSASIITGIVDDFHFSSLENKVMAVLIQKSPYNKPLTTMEIRMDGKNNSETIANIRTVWQQTYPEEYFTYTDVYHEFTKSNRKIFEMSRLLNMYSLISILLTCFGLFGIAFYAVRQRTQEIGIRKINGAKTPQLFRLLMQPMFLWMVIGFAVAAPLAWWLMERWLQQFVYRVDVSAGSFILAFIAVFAITLATVGWHVWRTARSNPVESLKAE